MAKPGDKVSVTTESETLTGILMPSDDKSVVLKLDSGYNIGLNAKRVKSMKVLEAHKQEKETPGEHTHIPGLPLITILHTGGTIASKVDYETGGVVARFSPQELLAQFPELRSIANIESRLVRNMFSEDMRFAHHNILAKEIVKEAEKGSRGIIITHGTDTLHYTAAALAFMVRPLPIPVILVGAQRSSDRGSSDAALNLVAAARFIVKSDFAGVGVCMHETMSDESCVILDATHCRKMHSTRRDAFRPVNVGPWARVRGEHIDMLRADHPKRSLEQAHATLLDEKLSIGILYSHPNMHADELKQYDGYDGVVVIGTGLGHLPINEIDETTKEHAKILASLKSLIKKGTVVVTSPQPIFGTVNLDVYATGRKMQEVGVLGNGTHMSPEVAFMKLAWLLSNHRSHVSEHWDQDLVGELRRSEPDQHIW